MRKAGFLFMLLSMLALLSACMQEPNPGNPVSDTINSTLANSLKANKKIVANKVAIPNMVNSALVPQIGMHAASTTTNKLPRFDVSVNSMPAKHFFMGLVKGTNQNMLVSPKIIGNISLTLKDVTILQVLEAVRDLYGYQYKITSYGYQIYPAGLQTRIFVVNYLNVSRAGQSHMVVRSGQITSNNTSGSSSGSTTTPTTTSGSTGTVTDNAGLTSGVQTESKNNFWASLQTSLETMVGKEKGAKVILNPTAGMVIITAMPKTLNEVGSYLSRLQSTMTRQVIIEAKILEINLDKGFQAGIDWSVFGASQSGGSLSAPSSGTQALADALGPFTSIFTLKATAGNAFSAAINLLSTQGNVQVLSSPRIATLNNQKAVIKVGRDQFFITNVSSSINGTGSDSQTSNDIELTPFFSGIALGVTPQISANGEVILHIHPMISEVTKDPTTFDIGSGEKITNLPLALSEIRESDSVVRAKSGQIVVIGGLMQTKTGEHEAETPLLGKLPIVGGLFRRSEQESTKSELVILLKPIVTSDQTWSNEIESLQARYKSIERPYHYGTHPDRFGNMAEKQLPKRF